MRRIIRTYPTPDTQRESCGPRERALAVFKYLMGLEPEEASKHPRFALIVNGFEQQRILGAQAMHAEIAGLGFPAVERPKLVEPLCEELTGTQEVNLTPRTERKG